MCLLSAPAGRSFGQKEKADVFLRVSVGSSGRGEGENKKYGLEPSQGRSDKKAP